jgi:hypothetical protein
MSDLEKIILISSPTDVVIFEIEDQAIVQKSEIESYSPGQALLEKAEEYIKQGSNPEMNPTYWAISGGSPLSSIQNWKSDLAELLTNSKKLRVNWSDLDNNTRVATVASEVSLLAINCRALPQKLIKEAKCATIFTAFGKIELVLS